MMMRARGVFIGVVSLCLLGVVESVIAQDSEPFEVALWSGRSRAERPKSPEHRKELQRSALRSGQRLQ